MTPITAMGMPSGNARRAEQDDGEPQRTEGRRQVPIAAEPDLDGADGPDERRQQQVGCPEPPGGSHARVGGSVAGDDRLRVTVTGAA
jgi:hypothetical protein